MGSAALSRPPPTGPGVSVARLAHWRSPPAAGCQRTMQASLTNFDYYAQRGAIFEVVAYLALKLSGDIHEGIFDDDARARREAEELLMETANFYGDLLTA